MISRCAKYLPTWLAGLAIIVCTDDLGAAAAPQTQPGELHREIPFALAIRGGVSLGSYEAGLNWALIRYMKMRRAQAREYGADYIELKAASGASAGSINALMSALVWCVDENQGRSEGKFSNSLDANLLHDTWLQIGFDELLPVEVESLEHFRADDGVLTRNAFEPAIDAIEGLLATEIFRPGCQVQLGLLVTRAEPVTMEIAGVQVHNQRFMIPIRVRVDSGGRARLESCLVDHQDPLLGNVLYLQGTRTGDPQCPIALDAGTVVNAMEASSAFPVAFGRKYLHYCERVAASAGMQPEQSETCPDGMAPVRADFVDGGLFDNIPLGAARALAEPRPNDVTLRPIWEATGRRFNYIYVDPTVRRPAFSQAESERAAPSATTVPDLQDVANVTFGIRSQLGFLGGAVQTGQDYELYNVLRGGEWTNQVFVYADSLTSAIEMRFPDLDLAQPDPARIQILAARCHKLFEQRWTDAEPPAPEVVARAHGCIAENTYALELQYRGVTSGPRLQSSAQITNLRNTVIYWIAKLARAIGEDRLALSVALAKEDKLGDRRILLSDRYSPLTGEMMWRFGAFIDRAFREYDYYAGIYDAVWGTANFICERQVNYAACMPAQVHEVYLALGVHEHLPANTVFLYLLQREYGDDPAWADELAWMGEYGGPASDANMQAIATSLFTNPEAPHEVPASVPTMTVFIRNLLAEDYDASESSEFLQRIFRLEDANELTWYYPLTLRASNRLLYLEREESRVSGEGYAVNTGLAMGAFVAHSFVREEEITLNQSTAPDFSWEAWMPYEVAADVRNGGLDVSWEPSFRMGRKGWYLALKVTPFQLNRYSGDAIWFSQADLFAAYKRSGFFSSVGFGPTYSRTWKSWPDSKRSNVGTTMYLGFVQDKVRLTFGQLSNDSEFPGDNVYINLGVTDFPGVLYWLSQVK